MFATHAHAQTKAQDPSFQKLYTDTKLVQVQADTRVGASLMRSLPSGVQIAVKAAPMPSGFAPAPLPDDDMAAPVVQKNNTDPYLKPEFYHRRIANANGMQANAHDGENRRGKGDISGGLALTVPLTQ
ncbi:hypothetical protein D5366_09390 [Neokomagataea tanensis]|uniref:Uncharacterized protein n=2 Tax=Neokomagataea TaxID=1223423 RepID=A0A4Y6V9W4_9PROT|nr:MULTISPECIES: hypothetical protein [Neokomagataea]QDH25391.1 hypothetical protein D5366_09390 [Neokomagataea tanensis]